MKNKIYFFLFIILIFPSKNILSQWSYLGLKNKVVSKIEIHEDTIYTGTWHGFYKKSIHAQDTSWIGIGFKEERILDFLIFDKHEIILSKYATMINDDTLSICKTNNGGQNWFKYQNGFGGIGKYKNPNAFRFGNHPLYPDTIYAFNGAIAKSMDKGINWDLIDGESWDTMIFQPTIMEIDNNHPNRIWAGGETAIFSAYLKKSIDHGNNWQFINNIYMGGDNACYCLLINPDNPDDVIVGMEGRIERSINGGDSWQTIFKPPNYPYIHDIEYSPNNKNTIYASGSKYGVASGNQELVIYKSMDYGINWDTLSYDDTNNMYIVYDMEILHSNDTDQLYLATNRGVYTYKERNVNINQGSNKNFNYELFQNYPNPFNPSTTISYSIQKSSFVTLSVYDIHGMELQTLVNEFQEAHTYSIKFDASQFSSGIYFYKLYIRGFIIETKKMLLVR